MTIFFSFLLRPCYGKRTPTTTVLSFPGLLAPYFFPSSFSSFPSSSYVPIIPSSSTSSSFFSLHQRPLTIRTFSTHTIRSGDTLIVIPREFINASFSRSSGAGGQNVNKVNTKAEIRFHLDTARWLDNDIKQRFRTLYGQYINSEGEVYVTSQEHRTQEANLEECYTKLSKFLRRSALVPKVRAMRTGLSELTKTERREDKRHRSAVKERRKGNGINFDE